MSPTKTEWAAMIITLNDHHHHLVYALGDYVAHPDHATYAILCGCNDNLKASLEDVLLAIRHTDALLIQRPSDGCTSSCQI